MNVENIALENTVANNTATNKTSSTNSTSTNSTSTNSNIKLNLQTIIKIFLQTYKINIEELFLENPYFKEVEVV